MLVGFYSWLPKIQVPVPLSTASSTVSQEVINARAFGLAEAKQVPLKQLIGRKLRVRVGWTERDGVPTRKAKAFYPLSEQG